MSKSLWELSEIGVRRVYSKEIDHAQHFREFAELPPPRGDEALAQRASEDYWLGLARVAATRRHALGRWPGVEGFGWPFPVPYPAALRHADKLLAEQAAS